MADQQYSQYLAGQTGYSYGSDTSYSQSGYGGSGSDAYSGSTSTGSTSTYWSCGVHQYRSNQQQYSYDQQPSTSSYPAGVGSGYVEDGREIFDDEIEEDIYTDKKNKQPPKKSFAGPQKRNISKASDIKNMFKALPAKRKIEQDVKLEDDDILGSIMEDLHKEKDLFSSMPKPMILRKKHKVNPQPPIQRSQLNTFLVKPTTPLASDYVPNSAVVRKSLQPKIVDFDNQIDYEINKKSSQDDVIEYFPQESGFKSQPEENCFDIQDSGDMDFERATNENNLSELWSLILQICYNATNYQDGAKFCLKAIMKWLYHNVPRVVMQTLTLLDACVKNCDKRFLLQVASSEFTTEVRKLLGEMHPSTAIKLKELLQKWSLEEFKDDPELCIIPALYYKLRSEGVEFPAKVEEKKPVKVCTDPNVVTSQEEENDIIKAIEISLKDTGRYPVLADPGSSDLLSGQTSKSLPEPFKVRATYDFEAAEDNELTIKTGEIVLILDNSNSSWWKGSNHRGEGLFPSNFVTEDLDSEPEQPTIQTAPVVEELSDITDEEVQINEEKIDTVLNWLNDVDPTEEASDPEDMVKLEKECYKMGPLIEENLQSIDKRSAMLNLVNVKIMSAFDLFHDLSDQYKTLPSNMKLYSPPASTLQSSYPQHFVPPVISSMQAGISNSVTQGAIPVMPSNINHISNEPSTNNAGENNKQILNTTETISVSPSTSVSTIPGNLSATVTFPQPNPIVQPTTFISSYGSNMMGSILVPPGMALPYQSLPQQGNFIPISGGNQNYANMVQPMGPYIPFPYYYVNNPPATPLETTTSTALPGNKTENTTFNATTSVSDVLNVTPLPSSTVSSYYSDLQQITTYDSKVESDQNTMQEPILNPSVQVSGDVQVSSSTNSS